MIFIAMSVKLSLNPTLNQTVELITTPSTYFEKILEESFILQEDGEFEQACQKRLDGVGALFEALPDDDTPEVEWEHPASRAAVSVLYFSANDHFLIGDFDAAASIYEVELELDPEDHHGAIFPLALCYVALECYDEAADVMMDLAEKGVEHLLLKMWMQHRQKGSVDAGDLHRFKERFQAYYEEFTCEEHLQDEVLYMELNTKTPSQAAQARDLWLRTESLWELYPDFIHALRGE